MKGSSRSTVDSVRLFSARYPPTPCTLACTRYVNGRVRDTTSCHLLPFILCPEVLQNSHVLSYIIRSKS